MMARTKRIYNRKTWHGHYHPYQVLCMGNCKACKDLMVSKRRRLRAKAEVRQDTQEMI
jgi:hypothetical protein